jgi:hypothetical protein
VKRRPRAAWFVTLLLGAMAAACGPTRTTYVDLTHTPRQYVPADYRSVHSRWTRTALITKEYDTSLDVAATWKSYDFRWAYTVRYSAVYQLTRPEQEALLSRQVGELQQSDDFYVSAAATRFEWVDFDKPNSVWRVVLSDDQGRELRPLEIKKLKIPAAELEAFFPPSTRILPVQIFYTPYLIRFPHTLPDGTPFIGPQTQRVTLRFAGVLGAAKLTWIMRRPGHAPSAP